MFFPVRVRLSVANRAKFSSETAFWALHFLNLTSNSAQTWAWKSRQYLLGTVSLCTWVGSDAEVVVVELWLVSSPEYRWKSSKFTQKITFLCIDEAQFTQYDSLRLAIKVGLEVILTSGFGVLFNIIWRPPCIVLDLSISLLASLLLLNCEKTIFRSHKR